MNIRSSKRDTLFIPYMMSPLPNPLDIYWSGDWAAANHLWTTLVELRADGTPSGRVATSWTTSVDQRTWTFSLRPERKWSDGSPMTTEQVVQSLKISLKGTSHSDLSSSVETISGHKDQISFKLRRPVPTLLVSLSYVDWAILHPSTVDPSNEKAKLKSATPVSGPFTLKKIEMGTGPVERLEFLRNPYALNPVTIDLSEGALEHYSDCETIARNKDRAIGFLSFAESFSEFCRNKLSADFNILQLQPTWVISTQFTRHGSTRFSKEERGVLLVLLHEHLAKSQPAFGVQRATGILPPYLFGSLNEGEFDDILKTLAGTEAHLHDTKSRLDGRVIHLVTMESWAAWKSFRWLNESLRVLGLKVSTTVLSRSEYFRLNGTDEFENRFDLNFIPFGVGDPDPDGTWQMASKSFPADWVDHSRVTEAFFETNRDKRAQLYKSLARELLLKGVYLPLRFDAPFIGVHKSLKLGNVAPFRAGLTIYDFAPASE